MFGVFKGQGQNNPWNPWEESSTVRSTEELGGEPWKLGTWLSLGPPLAASLQGNPRLGLSV